mmetsp:Transcript_16958/g.42035  ORF Transcript_16958/g.42035 Transcript_16958/m.42035 type:complete len:276 (-) Transcript_16958:1729-2556(-)
MSSSSMLRCCPRLYPQHTKTIGNLAPSSSTSVPAAVVLALVPPPWIISWHSNNDDTTAEALSKLPRTTRRASWTQGMARVPFVVYRRTDFFSQLFPFFISSPRRSSAKDFASTPLSKPASVCPSGVTPHFTTFFASRLAATCRSEYTDPHSCTALAPHPNAVTAAETTTCWMRTTMEFWTSCCGEVCSGRSTTETFRCFRERWWAAGNGKLAPAESRVCSSGLASSSSSSLVLLLVAERGTSGVVAEASFSLSSPSIFVAAAATCVGDILRPLLR